MASARLQADGDPIATAESLLAQGRAGDAARLLRRRLQERGGGLLLQLTLQKMLVASGDKSGALELARETAHTNPNAAPAALGLGEALLAAGQLPSAIGEFQRALRLDPDLWDARFALGRAWLDAGEAEKALDAFATIPAAAAPEEFADRVAAAQAMRAAQRSDPRYVRHLFDQFSSDYDSRMLGQLGYAAPGILRQLAEFVGVGDHMRILDLGCGTGLAGEAFRERVARLEGIDLSPAMIEKARARGIYNALSVGDLEETLARDAGGYDLILAADTLVYLGDLTKVMDGAVRTLAPGGFFLFTVEATDGEGFVLGPKRRWRHSDSYLRSEAVRAGLDVVGFMNCRPRSEAGIPVEGFAVAMQRVA
jgi:predicted TPR repeat methyltransferase